LILRQAELGKLVGIPNPSTLVLDRIRGTRRAEDPVLMPETASPEIKYLSDTIVVALESGHQVLTLGGEESDRESIARVPEDEIALVEPVKVLVHARVQHILENRQCVANIIGAQAGHEHLGPAADSLDKLPRPRIERIEPDVRSHVIQALVDREIIDRAAGERGRAEQAGGDVELHKAEGRGQEHD